MWTLLSWAMCTIEKCKQCIIEKQRAYLFLYVRTPKNISFNTLFVYFFHRTNLIFFLPNFNFHKYTMVTRKFAWILHFFISTFCQCVISLFCHSVLCHTVSNLTDELLPSSYEFLLGKWIFRIHDFEQCFNAKFGQSWKSFLYRWVFYWKTIRSTGYFPIETLFYRNSSHQNKKKSSHNFPCSVDDCKFLTRIFNFCSVDVLATRPFSADTFCRRYILAL